MEQPESFAVFLHSTRIAVSPLRRLTKKALLGPSPVVIASGAIPRQTDPWRDATNVLATGTKSPLSFCDAAQSSVKRQLDLDNRFGITVAIQVGPAKEPDRSTAIGGRPVRVVALPFQTGGDGDQRGFLAEGRSACRRTALRRS